MQLPERYPHMRNVCSTGYVRSHPSILAGKVARIEFSDCSLESCILEAGVYKDIWTA